MSSKKKTSETTTKKSLWSKLALIVNISIWVGFLLAWGILYLYVNGVSNNYNGYYGGMPSIEDLQNPNSEVASELYSADGKLLGKYFRSNRTPLSYREISPVVIDALMATEDIRYREHSGIDMRGSFSIPYYLLIKGKKKGASTVTQQLAKNLFETRNADYIGSLEAKTPKLGTLFHKTKEWILSVQLERMYSKDEIICMYLNTVSFGSNAFGLKVASQTFFGKDQKDLLPQEAAVLIGLLKAPTSFSPIINPEESLDRRNVVLSQMEKYKKISTEAYDTLVETKIKLSYSVENHNDGLAPYFRKIAAQRIRYWCKENGYDLYSDGLKIYTTIDTKLQSFAENALTTHMSYLQDKFYEHWEGRTPWTKERADGQGFTEYKEYLQVAIKRTESYRLLKNRFGQQKDSIEFYLNIKKPMTVFSYKGDVDTTMSSYDSLRYYKYFLHAGFASIEPRTGHIKAWVGGVDHKYFKYDHVIQGARQPGSTFKPIVYATILGETGNVYSPCYKVVDAPVTFVTGNPTSPTWTPENADGEYTGDTLTLRQAMARSVNSITAYMMKLMGDQTPQKVQQYAYNMGIRGPLEPVPAMCLGVLDVYLYDMIGAYATFANKGTHIKPMFITRIEDKDGNLIKEFYPEKRQVLSKELAYTMLYMLRGATEEEGGTGRGLYRYGVLKGDSEIGAKTGTTQNYSDGWFMGVTKDLVSGVWVGGEDRAIRFRSMQYGQGARMALPIWGEYMKEVYADSTNAYSPGPFEIPQRKNPNTGKMEDNKDLLYDCNNLHISLSDSTAQQTDGSDGLFTADEFE